MIRFTGIRILILLVSAAMLSCGPDNPGPVGKYEAEVTLSGMATAVYLELGENGRGSWATDVDNVDFRWDIDGNKIRIHTRSGGVIIGRIDDNSIEIHLPGVGAHHFTKVEG